MTCLAQFGANMRRETFGSEQIAEIVLAEEAFRRLLSELGERGGPQPEPGGPVFLMGPGSGRIKISCLIKHLKLV